MTACPRGTLSLSDHTLTLLYRPSVLRVLESREAYDIRPFVTGFGDTPGEAVTVYFDTADDAETGTGTHASYPTTVGADVRCHPAIRDPARRQ